MGDGAATDARATLKQLADAIERHFGSNLLGLYLFGSLAAGGFYPGKSDLDLMAIIAAEVEEGAQLEELRGLHDEFLSERPTWLERIEVSYVERGVLRTFGYRPRGRIVVVCPGEPLHIRDAGVESTLDWHAVTTQGETIHGPPPLDPSHSPITRWDRPTTSIDSKSIGMGERPSPERLGPPRDPTRRVGCGSVPDPPPR